MRWLRELLGFMDAHGSFTQKVRLETADMGYVSTVEIPPIRPDAILWGSRTFFWHVDDCYREGIVWVVPMGDAECGD